MVPAPSSLDDWRKNSTAAQRWKTQINENAKMPAWWSVLPELDHNEICGWGQPTFPGWAPLVDPGTSSLHAARSVGRWLWPTLAVTGFLALTGFIVRHDDPTPGCRSGAC